jgi:hypothetical protein
LGKLQELPDKESWLPTLKWGCIMVNMTDLHETIKKELPFTEEEMERLDKARKMPITFDEN